MAWGEGRELSDKSGTNGTVRMYVVTLAFDFAPILFIF